MNPFWEEALPLYFRDILDVLLLFLTIYWILNLIRGTRTSSILLGLTILLGAYIIAEYFNLVAFAWVMENLLSSAVIIVVVLFQADIRNALARLGLFTVRRENQPSSNKEQTISIVVQAAEVLSKKRIGGAIVFEQETGLRNFIDLGLSLQAKPNVDLITAVFIPQSPLHDGALIINKKGDIAAARCILPLSQQVLEQSFFGTRHRSAMGLVEETDAVVLVASEETGFISLFYQGKLYRNLSPEAAQKELSRVLIYGQPPVIQPSVLDRATKT